MIYSQADDKKAFKHVLKNVLELEDDHPLTLALDAACCYRDIRSILDMDQEDIDNLKYTTKDDEVVQIGVGVMSLHKFPALRNLMRYHLYWFKAIRSKIGPRSLSMNTIISGSM
jgi:hypothetical protein